MIQKMTLLRCMYINDVDFFFFIYTFVMSENAIAEKAPEKAAAKNLEKAAANKSEENVEEKKLSNKELKEQKKREKAAKRAAAKQGPAPSNEPVEAHVRSKSKTASTIKKELNQTKIKEDRKKIPPLFGHLETREQRNASSPQIANIVHPSVLSLTLKLSTYSIVGSIPRCRAMLLAFKDVVNSYSTPEGTTLSRHLTSHLSHQIEYLKTARPLSVSMGNTIRWLKQEISLISIDTQEREAKAELGDKIDLFIKEKIEYADKMIVESASHHITNGSTVLTFGASEVLEQTFLYCKHQQKKEFEIIIVDSRPLFEGRRLARKLCSQGLKCQYVLINALSSIFNDVDTVFLGAHAMLSNGRLYSRVGSALVAMTAKSRNIPVLVCCESIKFSDKVQLDSVTMNELADGGDLIKIDSKPVEKKGFALEQFLNQKKLEKNSEVSKQKQQTKANPTDDQFKPDALPLANWEGLPHLSILNIMYDLTPPEYIQKVITEVGSLPPSSVPVILREYKAVN